jgi:hypothetical protein
MPDIAMVAMLTAGVLFLVRSLRTHRLSDITLGALAAGLAFGMKWNGVADAVVLGAWALFMLARDRQPRRLLRPLLALPAIILGAGGFWLLRNALEAGNPVIPVRVSFLGLNAPRDEIRECVGFPVAHYLTSSHAWSTFILPGYRRFLGAPAALIVAGLLLALLVNRRAPMRIGLLTLVGVLVVVYMITPYSALGLRDQPVGVGVQARYLLPALAIAAAVAGAAFGTLRRRGTWIAGTCALIVVALGLRSGLELQRGENVDVGAGLVAAVGVALLGAAGCAALVRARLPLTRRRSAAIVALGVLALAGAAVGYSRQQTFFENRYQGGEPAIRWINTHATAGHRIALAGLWDTAGLTPVLPAYGPRFRNVAQYVAPAQQTVLRDYGTKSAWLGALRSGRYDLVLVGRGGYAPTCAVPGSHSDKDAWARDAGFPVVARSSRLTLYRVEF